jgi:hypothetical protein
LPEILPFLHVYPLCLLVNHGNNSRGALFATNATSLTPEQIGLKTTFGILLNTSFRTINLTNAAFDTFIKVIGRFLRTPIAGAILSGTTRFGDNTADFKIFPG